MDSRSLSSEVMTLSERREERARQEAQQELEAGRLPRAQASDPSPWPAEVRQHYHDDGARTVGAIKAPVVANQTLVAGSAIFS